MQNIFYPFVNIPLDYPYDALEPYIDEKTMELHHDRHLQTYIDNLNAILKENPYLQKYSLTQLITDSLKFSPDIRTSIRNNAGGVFNHRFYFNILKNPSEDYPIGDLYAAIESYFGSYEAFKKKFKQVALSVFGSGYAWLVCCKGRLEIITTPNQDCPIEKGYYPIITIDVWEHAYYLKHYNERSKYIDDWFKVINWEQAQKNYIICCKL